MLFSFGKLQETSNIHFSHWLISSLMKKSFFCLQIVCLGTIFTCWYLTNASAATKKEIKSNTVLLEA